MENYQNYKKMYDWKKPKSRKWVEKELLEAPIWCSVDLRDGNQALPNPMTLGQKITFFKYLVEIGFKDIEIGFPAASETEYNLTRYLIDNNLIPDDVKIQVLTQSRAEIIEKTFKALEGVKNAVVHLYNSTSELQRRVVFNKSKEEVTEIAATGAKMIVEYMKKYPETNWTFEYSPESFTGTEIDYAIDVINEVTKIWLPVVKNKPIINLPSTVENSTPNIFADQVEYVCDNLQNRKDIIISIHAHNDRGTAVATTELAILAGADRVEGTLFGNGERTGNADILNLGMNMYTLGVNPLLDFSNIKEMKDKYEELTEMEVGVRHPYAGDLVFTAFSGSHQDAIAKGMKYRKDNSIEIWEVPYLPVNPEDIGRAYEPVIRINSQSGKGGVAYILETDFGYIIPRGLKKEIGYFIKNISDNKKRELEANEILEAFDKEYINRKEKLKIIDYEINKISEKKNKLTIILEKTRAFTKEANGNGPIDALSKILHELGYSFEFETYTQHSLEQQGSNAKAISYISIKVGKKCIWGIGRSGDITKSALKALVSAINRMEGIYYGNDNDTKNISKSC